MPLNPLKVAKAAYKPSPEGMETLERVGFWRSLIGLATTVLVSIDVRPVSDVVVDDTGTNVIRNAILGLLAVPASMLLVYFLTHREARRELRFLPVFGRVALLITTVFMPVYLITEYLMDTDLPFTHDTEITVVNSVGTILMLGLLLWWPPYMLSAIYWAGRTYCWVGEFHPLLAPTVTAGMTTVLTIIDVAAWKSNGLPVNTWLTLVVTGAITTLILAAVEYVKLVRRGVGWRTGPRTHQPTQLV